MHVYSENNVDGLARAAIYAYISKELKIHKIITSRSETL